MARFFSDYFPELKGDTPVVFDIAVDLGDIADVNGNEILEFDAVASAVNHIGVQNAATGGNPTIYAAGEADTGLTFENSENEEVLILDSAATSVNEVTITSAAAGSNPSIAATGDDTNISLQLTAKASGAVLVGNGATGTITAGAGGVGTLTSNNQRIAITVPQLGIVSGSPVIVDLTNNKITPSSILFASWGANAHTTGSPTIVRVTAGVGSATIVVSSTGGAAINGALVVNLLVQ